MICAGSAMSLTRGKMRKAADNPLIVFMRQSRIDLYGIVPRCGQARSDKDRETVGQQDQ